MSPIFRVYQLPAFFVVLLAAVGQASGGLPLPRATIEFAGQDASPQAETPSFVSSYESGVRSLRLGQAEQAIESLTKAVHLNPSSKPARCALGQAFVNADRYIESIEQFQKCAELEPGDIQTQYNLGQAYLRLALTTADNILESSDTSSYARRIFAENYIGKNDFPEAETQYLLALKTDPEATDLHLALGGLYERTGNLTKARKEFRKILDVAPASVIARYRLAEVDFIGRDFGPALTELRSIAGANPEFLRSRADFLQFPLSGSSVDELCLRLSKTTGSAPGDAALAFLENACRHAVRNLPLQGAASSSGERSSASVLQGDKSSLTGAELCEVGRCAACEERLRNAPSGRLPDNEILSEVGRCAYTTGNYTSAYVHFGEALTHDPQNLALLYWLQESARLLAAQCFERVKETDPDSYLVHLLNARSWEEQDQPGRAIQEYQAAIARRPEAINVRVLLGHLHWKWREYDDALQPLTEALRLDPDNPVVNYLLGDIWVQEHHPEKAVAYLNKAILLRPGFLDAKASRARALVQLGRLQEALAELEAVAPSDRDGTIHYQIYQICLKLGKHEEAEAALAVREKLRAHHRRATDLF